jgi:hypothetical protein
MKLRRYVKCDRIKTNVLLIVQGKNDDLHTRNSPRMPVDAPLRSAAYQSTYGHPNPENCQLDS